MQLSDSDETAPRKEEKQLLLVGSASTAAQIPMYESGGTSLTKMIRWADADVYANKVIRHIMQPAALALATDLDAIADLLGIGWGEA